MELFTLIVLSVIAFASSTAQKLELPVTTCKRNSSDYRSCLTSASQEAWPRFVRGLPEFNVPTLDPYIFGYEKLVVNTNQIYGEIISRKGVVKGLLNTRFLVVNSRLANDAFHLIIETNIPIIYVDIDCEGQAKIIDIGASGKANLNATMKGINTRWDITGTVANDTWIIEHCRMHPTMESFKMSIRGLFDGNQDLNNLVEQFMNEYWPLVYRIMLPVIQESADKWITERMNKVFPKISFSKTFP